MTEGEAPHIYLAIVPRSDTDSPTYWWSALRFVQAGRTMDQLEPIAKRLLQRIQATNWPWVRGIPDEPHPGALTWEVPYTPIVQAQDKREASFIASQTLHYLRSCLDHLVYNASWIDSNSPKQMTQFPICDNRAKWGRGKILEQLGGMSDLHSSWIEAVQPFNGVRWTRLLQDMSNADKHRFGIEVSPTCQLKVNVRDAIDDPRNRGIKLAQIEEVSIRYFLPALDPCGEFVDIFNEMLSGTVDLLNLFLGEAGIEKIKIGPQKIVRPESE